MRIVTFITLLTIFTACFALSSCNTINGMGQDMQKGGQAISNAAK